MIKILFNYFYNKISIIIKEKLYKGIVNSIDFEEEVSNLLSHSI